MNELAWRQSAGEEIAARRPCAPLVAILSPLTAWSRFCRRLVDAKLHRMKQGALHVVDADGARRFGASGGECENLEATIVVHNPRLYGRLVRDGSLGLAESFVDGDWETSDLPKCLDLFARNQKFLQSDDGAMAKLALGARGLRRVFAARNTRRGSRRNIRAHYDLSNEFFAEFLDPTMTYSCGLFADQSTTLEEASLAKYDRICQKLALTPHDRVLEIGCGWGGFAEFAAAEYGCRVTGVTISRRQHEFAVNRIAHAKLARRVDIRLCDYRDLAGEYDKLVSIEMIEAVGHAYLPAFFRQCCRLLKPEGVMALQAITVPDQRYAAYRRSTDFIREAIFPGGHLPSLGAIGEASAQATDLRMIHCEDFAANYARTLGEWRRRFLAADGRIAALGFDAEFRRAWDYYLSSCAAGFAARLVGLCQMVLARPESRHEVRLS